MKAELLQDVTLDAMANYMTRLSRRQEVVASNIANIDTPGYKTRDISFHATLQELLEPQTASVPISPQGHEGLPEWRLSPLGPEVFEVPNLPSRPDRNNVNIDQEMLKLSGTSFGYSMIAQLLRMKFRTIASSINEGRAG